MESSAKQAKFGKMGTGIVVAGLNGNRIPFDRATIGLFGKTIERSDTQMYIVDVSENPGEMPKGKD